MDFGACSAVDSLANSARNVTNLTENIITVMQLGEATPKTEDTTGIVQGANK